MINYEMALSEIEMYKKAHESLSENLTHANKEAQRYKTERDTLIDDIAVLKANISRLERENEKLKSGKENLTNRVRNLDLHLQIQHDELMSCDGEMRYWKDKYTTLTNHIRDIRSDMMKLYENYEVQKHINKDEGIHKILEGAQISLAVVLDELSKIDELERADDER